MRTLVRHIDPPDVMLTKDGVTLRPEPEVRPLPIVDTVYTLNELALRFLQDNGRLGWDENAARLLRGILGSRVSQDETADEMGVGA